MAEYRTLGLRLMIICLVAALALAGVNALTEPVIKAREEAALEGVGTLAAGDYTGTARGFGGDVVVEFTVGDDGTITAISASGDGETAGVGTLAFEESYLNNFIGASFPVTVDTLAGATYTSSAIIDALNAAASGGSGSGGGSGAATEGGTFTGSGQGFGGEITATVTFNADGTIASVTAVGDAETPGIGSMALEEDYLAQFVGLTCPVEIDTVAGASYSSNGLMDAINDAGEQFAAAGPAEGGSEGGSAAGASFTGSGQGFGGAITATVTFNADGTIASVTAVGDAETPGIGSMALEEDYLAQFVGLTCPVEIDTVAGASYSSNGLMDAINDAGEQFAAGN